MQLTGDSTFFGTFAANKNGKTAAGKAAIEKARQDKIDLRNQKKADDKVYRATGTTGKGKDGCPINVKTEALNNNTGLCKKTTTKYTYKGTGNNYPNSTIEIMACVAEAPEEANNVPCN
jgi:hypothetical protein